VQWTESEDLPWLSLTWRAKEGTGETPTQQKPTRVTHAPQNDRR
jgi:hypothetical protein